MTICPFWASKSQNDPNSPFFIRLDFFLLPPKIEASEGLEPIDFFGLNLTIKIPSNWASFLRVYMNKEELFNVLAKYIRTMAVPQRKHVYVTFNDRCL